MCTKQLVTKTGWVKTIRDHGGIIFLRLSRRDWEIQTVVEKDDLKKIVRKLKEGSVIRVRGRILKTDKVKEGKELKAEEIEILSKAKPLPFKPEQEKVDLSLWLDYRWISLRTPKQRLVFELWTELERSFYEFFSRRGFVLIHPPTIVQTATEGGAEVFEIKYFKRKAYLAQSAQFYKQMAMAGGLEKVFDVTPVFRAQWSFTTRHDTEFTQYDIEISFIEEVEEIMKIEERFLRFALREIKRKLGGKIKELYGKEILIPKVPFPRISFEEAKKLCRKARVKGEKEFDLSPAQERYIGKWFKEKTGSEFVFITDWPIEARPFYHQRYKEKPWVTKSFDLLFKGLEITTGSIREHRPETLRKQAREKGIKLSKGIRDYIKFFEYGCPPHGGLGFGPSRFIKQILGLSSVKEATFVYRGPKRISP